MLSGCPTVEEMKKHRDAFVYMFEEVTCTSIIFWLENSVVTAIINAARIESVTSIRRWSSKNEQKNVQIVENYSIRVWGHE